MNISNILKTAEAIEQASVPGLGFNMGFEFFTHSSAREADKTGRECDTVACIAGWTCVLELGVTATSRLDYEQIADRAQALFGLAHADRSALFYPYGKMDAIEPADAVRALRILAITGKVDWSAAMKGDEPVLPPLPVSKALANPLTA